MIRLTALTLVAFFLCLTATQAQKQTCYQTKEWGQWVIRCY
jgi:hypothetical protein